ncbi:histidinol dehydrogenase [Agarivorans sp. B2Z047]|uniref:histidinol dehydrogenase n=1 Tax=Agarivorans sp. B2Z047 TaxID=2652721 RepID=UPI00128E1C95|nr:histidinol dehydrogenase [Agarivorans sp. B2Z047]MPW29504.1 histidinol dehydrogenase [Agarivorans sp. B2Z047]UQN45091.1 histidinol dehydrogenase [Agarivorans sp. B2Z047]
MQTVIWKQLNSEQQLQVLSRPAVNSSTDIAGIVADVVSQVREQGDKALIALAAKFDNTELSAVRVSQQEIEAAEQGLSEEFKQAVAQAKANIEVFHQAQKPQPISLETQPGVRCEMHYAAIGNVGLYVPGGTAPLPSTVLMLAIPARIAGCKKVVLSSPPPIAPEILYTANLCGVDEVYAAGGAQAIAAMAYGTESVSKADKIFGPGNAFVTQAKQQVSGDHAGAAIDMPAGPSEVLVIADNKANPAFVAADLLSQAEHGPDSQVILVTTSEQQAEAVNQELARQLALLSRNNIADQALSHSTAIVVNDLAQAVQVSNLYGPEHLIVQTEQARDLLPEIENAGSVFLGEWTPESVGDYASGTNHTLPTYGYTRTYSSLGTLDFMKRFTVQELSQQGLKDLSRAVVPIANAEGLDAHRRAVTLRLGEEQ